MGPFRDLSFTLRSGSEPKSSPGGSEVAKLTPEGSGEAERSPWGSGELGTSSVGPDWAVAALTIILDEPRPMSFDSSLMVTVLSVTDSLLHIFSLSYV
jgi:hypothetical protein